MFNNTGCILHGFVPGWVIVMHDLVPNMCYNQGTVCAGMGEKMHSFGLEWVIVVYCVGRDGLY